MALGAADVLMLRGSPTAFSQAAGGEQEFYSDLRHLEALFPRSAQMYYWNLTKA
jgi:hypothetical protein